MSTGVGLPVVPAPVNLDFMTTSNWLWEVTLRSGDDAPKGKGSNWGLEASRLPQAWNLLEAIRRKAPLIQTALLENGFQAHRDLTRLSILSGDQALCWSGPSGDKCTENHTESHGNLSAGALGADYDFPGGQNVGVVGVNPTALMLGTPY